MNGFGWMQGFLTAIAVSGSGGAEGKCDMSMWKFFVSLLKYGIPAVFAGMILVVIMFALADFLIERYMKW